MADIVFVLITIAFFGLCAAYVRACDRIIGPDEPTPDAIPTEVTAGVREAGRS